jgi:hypothetical protein
MQATRTFLLTLTTAVAATATAAGARTAQAAAVVAAAAAPAGGHSQKRGAKRSADVAGIKTQLNAAAQRDAPARAAAAKKKPAVWISLTRPSGAHKTENLDSMSK